MQDHESERFLAALPGPLDAAVSARLGVALTAALDAAEAAWPEIRVARPAFAEALAGRLPPDVPPLAALASLDVAGLYLAHACILGDSKAQARLDARCIADLDAVLRASGLQDGQIGEVKQRVRNKLLVGGPDGPPRLAGYSGRGELRGFVRVVAVREGVGLLREVARREHKEVSTTEDQLERATIGEDPEMLLIKGTHRAALREAFAAALAELDHRERTLLRLAIADGLTIDQLGVVFQVHRTTAARWLVAVREKLFKATRRGLMKRLQIDRQAFESLMRTIQSHFEISVCEFLHALPG
jgi:RNA polymerase sigma-70 factor (ECF subfamily)